MHIDDAAAFILESMRNPPSGSYGTYGYEFYLPNVISAYLKKMEPHKAHPPMIDDDPIALKISPLFQDALWELCRRGVLRPSVKHLTGQGDSGTGNGFSLTALGRSWLDQGLSDNFIISPGRMGELFAKFAERLGQGFLQRASEAVHCHRFGTYLSCCAMCGAAAESILLAIGSVKLSDAAALKIYRGRDGRRVLIKRVVENTAQPIASRLESATRLLSYWRDDAAHGLSSTISEIEAHEAIRSLLQFAQFAVDYWAELTSLNP